MNLSEAPSNSIIMANMRPMSILFVPMNCIIRYSQDATNPVLLRYRLVVIQVIGSFPLQIVNFFGYFFISLFCESID